MDDGEELALESAWQDMLVGAIALNKILNTGDMLRAAFIAGWDARHEYDNPPEPEPEPEEGS